MAGCVTERCAAMRQNGSLIEVIRPLDINMLRKASHAWILFSLDPRYASRRPVAGGSVASNTPIQLIPIQVMGQTTPGHATLDQPRAITFSLLVFTLCCLLYSVQFEEHHPCLLLACPTS